MKAAALWIRLAKGYGRMLKEVQRLPRHGLTLPQFDCLAQLLRHPGGMTPSALSRSMLVTAGNVTGIVARLETRGLVARRAHPVDRRARVLTLTPRGRRVAAAEVSRHERHLERLLSPLGAPERARVARGLDRIRTALETPLRRSA